MAVTWWHRSHLGLGVAVTVSALWHVVTAEATQTFSDVVALVVICVSGVGLFYGGYQYADRPFYAERSRHVGAWMATITLLFVGVSIVSLYIGSRTVTPAELLGAVHVAGSIGLVTGFFVGTSHAEALRNAEMASRSKAEAAALEAEQERLERLNDLLRHYILNGMNIIQGYTARLRTDSNGADETLDVIDERAAAIVTLVDHVRLVSGVSGTDAVGPVDLSQAVASAVADLDADASVHVAVPEGVPRIRAANVSQALVLLLGALDTVCGSEGTLSLDCETRESTVVLHVTATAVDLPPSGWDPLFDIGGPSVGLKFHLVRTIIEDFADLCLTEGADGTLRADLTFDRATASPGAA